MIRLTAARVTSKAKLATSHTHRWSTERGVDSTFLARVRDAEDTSTELRLLNAARDAFRRSGYEATVVSLGGGRRPVTYRLMVTDLDARQEGIDRAADKRAAALDAARAEVIARRVAEIEAVAEAAEPEGVEEFVGEIKPTCAKCLYLSGHASWCSESPVAGLSGEIRTDESGVARYWTAEEIRVEREAQTARGVQACRVCGGSTWHPSGLCEFDRTAAVEPAPLCNDRCPCTTLTAADVLAMATGHPAGSALRKH